MAQKDAVNAEGYPQRYTSTGIFECVSTLTVSLPRTTAETPRRPCEAITIKSHLLAEAASMITGIAEAVAGFVADVGMHEPSPQETFADHARLLHHARRADIVHVTKRTNPENGRLAHGPIHDFGENLCHEALPPPGSRREVADVETVWSGLTQGPGERQDDERNKVPPPVHRLLRSVLDSEPAPRGPAFIR